MIEDLKNLMTETGASWVLWTLIALSVLSVAVMIERLRAFAGQRGDVRALTADLHRMLGARELERARQRLAQTRSAEASVASAGLAEWDRGRGAVQEAMAAASGLERARLEKRLLFLGTVGNNAPFIGLLGTVIGVVGAFEQLGRGSALGTAQLAPEQVMSTIAEALVATAAGLVVAIPAVAVYNYFQGKLTAMLANADTLGHVVLAHLAERSHGDE